MGNKVSQPKVSASSAADPIAGGGAEAQESAYVTGQLSEITTKYKVEQKILGKGHYGTVSKCFLKKTNEPFAVKKIEKRKVKKLKV